jgi:tagaturonate epimerase
LAEEASLPNLCEPLGLAPSFGFGDRIGLATPGHVRAMLKAGGGIEPIFPQQSIREMTRTQRTPDDVIRDALAGMRAAGWTGRTGADADHLKTWEDVDRTAAAGYTFYTIDPSEFVDEHADGYDETTLWARFEDVRGQIDWFERYVGKTVPLPTGTQIELSEAACMRCAVKYGPAINRALELAGHISAVHASLGRDYEIELSVDETEQPTTLAEHYIIAEQCLGGEMKLVSLAPRYVGDFEKGVDYKGNAAALEASLRDHAAIADMLGPYKLSLHSGSDKLTMYPALARATRGRFHVKTAGTSYLEALRVVARHDQPLFRRIVTFARERYDIDKATYHVSATLASAPPESEVPDAVELERLYLERWEDVPAGRGFTQPGRQILHCTFGSVLTHPEFGPAVRAVLEANPETYAAVLEEHFVRHLNALRAGMA